MRSPRAESITGIALVGTLLLLPGVVLGQSSGGCGDILAQHPAHPGVPARSNGVFQGTPDTCGGSGVFGEQYQCVEYVRRFYSIALGVDTSRWPRPMHAVEFYSRAGELGLTPFPNGGTVAPAQNDIIVFRSATQRFGHVAIVTGVSSSTVGVIEQNFSRTGLAVLDRIPGSNMLRPRGTYEVVGWIRRGGTAPQQRTIVVDGGLGDWAGIVPVLTDPAGDGPFDAFGRYYAGEDFVRISAANDAINVYFLMEFAAAHTGGIAVMLDTDLNTATGCSGAEYLMFVTASEPGGHLALADFRDCGFSNDFPGAISSVPGHFVSRFLEAAVGIQTLRTLTPGMTGFRISAIATAPPPSGTPDQVGPPGVYLLK